MERDGEKKNDAPAEGPGTACRNSFASSGESAPRSAGSASIMSRSDSDSRVRGGRSALISDLVAQLKRGDISKAELFARLQQLQGSTAPTGGTPNTSEVVVGRGPPSGVNRSQPPSCKARFVAQDSDLSPASSGSSAVAAGAAAAEVAGFFSTNDRQAIIKKIADERRRRAQEVRESWPERPPISQPQSLSLADQEDLASATQSHPMAMGSSTSQSSQQMGTSSLLLNPPSSAGAQSSSSSGAPVSENGSGPIRKTAWTPASEVTPASTYNVSAAEFPFPSHTSNHRGRRDPQGKGNDESRPSSHVGAGGKPQREGTWPLRETITISDSSGPSGVAGDSSKNETMSCSSNNCDHSKATSRRRNSGSGVSGSGNGYGEVPPGWSLYAKHLSRNNSRFSGKAEGRRGQQDGDERVISGSSPSPHHPHTPLRPHTLGWTPISRVESWSHGGRQAYESDIVYPNMSRSQPGSGAELRWTESGALEFSSPEKSPNRGEWNGSRGGGERGGGENERTVDEEAYHFRSFSEERARRGEELVRRELMSECTFTPKIKGLPQSYGATNHDDAPFLQRVSQWQRDKEKDAATRKTNGKDKELESCTFTPHVNRVSRRAAVSRREALGENHLAVDDRLYDESIRRGMDRSLLAAGQAAREEERLNQDCTFTPEFYTKRSATATAVAGGGHRNETSWGYTVPRGQSKYRQAAAAVAAAAAAMNIRGGSSGGEVWGAGRRANGGGGGERKRYWELETCTFTPTVIGARKGMDQAQQYLQYGVVERLTGAAFRPPGDNDNRDGEGREETTVSMNTLCGRSRYDWEAGSDNEDKITSACAKARQEKRESSDSTRRFHAFLSRQNKTVTNKLKYIEAMQELGKNPFRPEICPESVKIHQESNKGDFLQRVAREAARKEHDAVRQQAAGKHDPDCTFKPQISARSATLQGRSVVELSRGDQLKRETTQRLTKLRTEQELLADTTFRPRTNVNAVSRMAVSRLKVVSDPDNYIATVESIRRRKQESAVRGAMERAVKEVEGCTFRPEITECPTYITRIAQSISASKIAAGKKQVQVKPDWR